MLQHQAMYEKVPARTVDRERRADFLALRGLPLELVADKGMPSEVEAVVRQAVD